MGSVWYMRRVSIFDVCDLPASPKSFSFCLCELEFRIGVGALTSFVTETFAIDRVEVESFGDLPSLCRVSNVDTFFKCRACACAETS